MPQNKSNIRRFAYRIKRGIEKPWNRYWSFREVQRRFWRDWHTYEQMPGAELLRPEDAYPRLYDRTATTPFDSHYFYQDIWAAKAIHHSGTQMHVDIGSDHKYAGLLTAFTHVVFVDIRPLKVTLEGFESREGSILNLPFETESVQSLSCLHVAEHIGLGRYGDPLDPLGTKKATKELARILAQGGDLYFSLPVGKPRVCFNAHRIHSPQQILEYFTGLRLVDFNVVDDSKIFVPHADWQQYADARYACGMFQFTKG